MSTAFDPYHRWLGISPKDQPPNHYRLLGVDRFESDLEVIRDAAERQIAHVRTYQLGEYSELSQRILNELAGAKACLLDPASKSEYDRRLQTPPGGAAIGRGPVRAGVPPPPPAPPERVGTASDPPVRDALEGSAARTRPTRGGPTGRTLRWIDAMLVRAAGERNTALHWGLRVLAAALPLAIAAAICLPLCRYAGGKGSEKLAAVDRRTPAEHASQSTAVKPPTSEHESLPPAPLRPPRRRARIARM